MTSNNHRRMDATNERARRERAAVYCFLNLVGLSVAMFNIICAYKDVNRNRINKEDTNGLEGIIILNLVLLVGILFGRQLLLATWICVYSCILLSSCIQTMINDEFPWVPGISHSSTVWIMSTFNLPEKKRPVVATALTLGGLMLIFVVFMTKSLESYKKRQERICRTGIHGRQCSNQDRLGHLRSLLLQALQERDPPRYALSSDPPHTAAPEDNPPAYSDLEEGTSNLNSSSTMPPAFEDAVKEGGDSAGEADKEEFKNVKEACNA